MTHTLDHARHTLHGHWSRDLAPALTIDPGDTVSFRCLDAMWCVRRPREPGDWDLFEPRIPGEDDGHALTGPVAVRGARPGMFLEIAINAIIPGTWAWTVTWPTPALARALSLEPPIHAQIWDIDPAAMIATDRAGRRVPLSPFLGVMGVAPPEPGRHSTTPPRAWGGNLDCKELVAGTTLYLPVAVEGALFSCGDGHGAQGDGEVCGNAIECPIARADLTFNLRTDLPNIHAPIARTPAAWITFGLHPDLNLATQQAIAHMLTLLQHLHPQLTRHQAYMIASVAANLRITQIVNQTQGVHCILPDAAVTF